MPEWLRRLDDTPPWAGLGLGGLIGFAHRQALDAWTLDELLGQFVTYDLRWGGRRVRLIVLGRIAKHPRNAPWELFSVQLERFRHGVQHYRPHASDGADLLTQLYVNYRLEIPQMSYTLDDFRRDNLRLYTEHWQDLPADIREFLVDMIPVEDRLRSVGVEDRLQGLDPELVKAWLKSTEH